MRTLICRHCHECVQVPEGLAKVHCVRCGRPIDSMETAISATPLPSNTHIAPPTDAPLVISISNSASAPLAPLPKGGPYASWEDFYTNSPAVQRELLALGIRPLPDLRHVQKSPPPKDVPTEVADLGTLVATLHKPGEFRVAHIAGGIIIALISLGVGFAFLHELLNSAAPQGKGTAEIMFMVASVGLGSFGCFVLGVWYAYFRTPLFDVALWVFDDGVLCRQGKRLEVRRWDEVRDFQVSMEHGHPVFWLTPWLGTRLCFSRTQGPDAVPILEFIEIKLTAARFLPTLRRIFEREQMPFGDVEIDSAGLSSPRFYAPWSSISQVSSDPNYLIVGRRDTQDWHYIRYRNVSFPHLLLALCRVLVAEEGRIGPWSAPLEP